jgi:gamma-glutamylaminecyclotransferase
MHAVFIYGTLKRGFQNDGLRPPKLRFVSACRTVERFPLVVAGKWFSPVLLEEPGAGEQVAGELFSASAAVIARLDLLEGTTVAGGYRRVSIRVERIGDGAVCEALAYTKSRDDAGAIMDGPMPVYPRDPRYVLPGDRDRVFG